MPNRSSSRAKISEGSRAALRGGLGVQGGEGRGVKANTAFSTVYIPPTPPFPRKADWLFDSLSSFEALISNQGDLAHPAGVKSVTNGGLK